MVRISRSNGPSSDYPRTQRDEISNSGCAPMAISKRALPARLSWRLRSALLAFLVEAIPRLQSEGSGMLERDNKISHSILSSSRRVGCTLRFMPKPSTGRFNKRGCAIPSMGGGCDGSTRSDLRHHSPDPLGSRPTDAAGARPLTSHPTWNPLRHRPR
jgi:hypothetical protein